MSIFQQRKGVFLVCTIFFFVWGPAPAFAGKGDKTYAISLTKTAGLKKGKIEKVGEKKVLVSPYVVGEGEHVWEILRKKRLLKTGKVGEVLSVLRELNPALRNLDLIHPGQRILIPLKIVPLSGVARKARLVEKTVNLADLKKLNIESYTVQRGDSLTRVIEGRYGVPARKLYGEYLALVRKLNPDIKNINMILPGQRIKLPIYSPEVVRKPIIPERFQEKGKKPLSAEINPIGHDLANIFSELGMNWVHSGQLFIPLSTGGQINLKAEFFPVLNTSTGKRVLVDLNNDLPERMADLIESSWSTYRIVHITKKDDLHSALSRIFAAAGFKDSDGTKHPLKFGGDVRFRITGDWIIPIPGSSPGKPPGMAVLTLREPYMPAVPWMIQDYLDGLGIKVVDYPAGDDYPENGESKVQHMALPGGPKTQIEMVLKRLGLKVAGSLIIPVYQSKAAGLKLLIKADLYMKIKGQDCIIDFSGVGKKMMPFLTEHGFRVLSLKGVKDPLDMLSKTLKFSGVPFIQGPQSFPVCKRDASRNILLTITAVSFKDKSGQAILAVKGRLPEEIVAFLWQNGYEVLGLHSGTAAVKK